jgi:hypothetical protein
MSYTEPIIDGIRRKIQHWAATTELLTANGIAGSDTIQVRSARRFSVGDEFLIRNDAGKTENHLLVDEVLDNTHIKLQRPLQFSWYTSQMASVVRTFNDDFVRAIHYGEPDVMAESELPAITVDAKKSTSEWLTTRATKERYDIEIGIFVLASTHEKGSRVLSRLTDCVEKGLKQNLYPLANDFEQTTLLATVEPGDIFIRIPDTSPFNSRQIIMLENDFYTQEFIVKCVVDSTTLELAHPVNFNYDKTNTTVIIPHRAFYNSWPADITYGKINKGTLLKAATISFFLEEMENQLTTSWHDTQLR